MLLIAIILIIHITIMAITNTYTCDVTSTINIWLYCILVSYCNTNVTWYYINDTTHNNDTKHNNDNDDNDNSDNDNNANATTTTTTTNNNNNNHSNNNNNANNNHHHNIMQ